MMVIRIVLSKGVRIGAFLLSAGALPFFCLGQATAPKTGLTLIRQLPVTSVKSQDNTGTCWSYSTTSLVESQTIKNGKGTVDLSEMFTVRNIYREKAVNYVLRQGNAQFGPGGLGHDVIHAMETYGAMPESAYTGLTLGQQRHDHGVLDKKLKAYLDSLLKLRPLPGDWMKGFDNILNDHLGEPPTTFVYGEKTYTPVTFAKEVLHFSANDYVNITSFTHHPFYSAFVLEAPDNALNGMYYNLPIDELLELTRKSIESGYTIMWDSDVSNKYFRQQDGYAMMVKDPTAPFTNPDEPEVSYTQAYRQSLYENLTTQDDHLMHLIGIEKSATGKIFFLVKNSWGEIGPFKGFIHVSESYFAINTVSVVIPKAALDTSLKSKLKMN
jgi:bleomycin hydrolase